MITIKQIRGTRDYFQTYLSQNEYYSEGEKVMGVWRGKLAKMLGIEGLEVTTENFSALGNNRHPVTGEKLRPRSAKVSFHDVVISAPKSYSIAALVGKDERLIEGFQRAVEKTFRRLENHIAVRDRAGTAYHTENFFRSGNGAAAVFLHDDNRLLDPQLHMHLVLSNHSFDSRREQFLALQPKAMMEEAKRWITDQFHRDLAREAVKAGYKVDLTGNRLRLPEVGLKLEYKFSKRTQHRRNFEKRYRKIFGSKPDAKRIEHFIKDGRSAARERFAREYRGAFGVEPKQDLVDSFVVDWRSQKKTDLGDAEKRHYQLGQLTRCEQQKLDRLVDEARRQSRVNSEKGELPLAQSERLTESGAGSSKEDPTPNEESLQETERSRMGLRRKPRGRRKEAITRRHREAIGRTEAIRRMRRGMAICQAVRGHPMVFMLQQVSHLARKG